MATITTLVTFMVVLVTVQQANAYIGSLYRKQIRPEYEDDMPAFPPGAPVTRNGMFYQQRRSGMNLLEDDPQDAGCKGLPCQDDNGCCEAMVCKLPEPVKKVPNSAMGTCIPNPSEGKPCKQDAICGSGMECALTAGSRGYKTCQPKSRSVSHKQYYDDCRQSSECDISRGLCCQAFRRHRQSPRQVCSHITDVSQCLGFHKDYMPVEENDIQPDVMPRNKWGYMG